MRICLLTTQNLDAQPFPANDWPCDPRPFLPEAHWDVATLQKATCVEHVSGLLENGYDLFFNLCDGAADQDIPGIEVVQTLEAAGVPFTGATSVFYEPSRQAMKQACVDQGIPTPSWAFARTEEDVALAAESLRFPLFVKHYSSYSSVSLTRASRVCTPGGLRRQAHKIIKRHGAALIEEFVDGVECTVLVAENPDDATRPTAYTPMQYRFPEGESFKHAKMKWVDYSKMACFPVTDPVLDAKLRDVSARFFVALHGEHRFPNLWIDACDAREVEQDGARAGRTGAFHRLLDVVHRRTGQLLGKRHHDGGGSEEIDGERHGVTAQQP